MCATVTDGLVTSLWTIAPNPKKSTGRLTLMALALIAFTIGAANAQFAVTPGVGAGTRMGVNPTSSPGLVGCPVASSPVVVLFDVSNPMGMVYYSLWNQPPGVLPAYSPPGAVSGTMGQV